MVILLSFINDTSFDEKARQGRTGVVHGVMEAEI